MFICLSQPFLYVFSHGQKSGLSRTQILLKNPGLRGIPLNYKHFYVNTNYEESIERYKLDSVCVCYMLEIPNIMLKHTYRQQQNAVTLI